MEHHSYPRRRGFVQIYMMLLMHMGLKFLVLKKKKVSILQMKVKCLEGVSPSDLFKNTMWAGSGLVIVFEYVYWDSFRALLVKGTAFTLRRG